MTFAQYAALRVLAGAYPERLHAGRFQGASIGRQVAHQLAELGFARTDDHGCTFMITPAGLVALGVIPSLREAPTSQVSTPDLTPPQRDGGDRGRGLPPFPVGAIPPAPERAPRGAEPESMTTKQLRDAMLQSMMIANEARRANGHTHADESTIRELLNNALGAIALEYEITLTPAE